MMPIIKGLLYVCLMISIQLYSSNATNIPGFNQMSYKKLGDINIGAMPTIRQGGHFSLLEEPLDGALCGNRVSSRGAMVAQMAIHVVDRINSDPDLLPNITLGLHIQDNCGSELTSLANAIDFTQGIHNNNK